MTWARILHRDLVDCLGDGKRAIRFEAFSVTCQGASEIGCFGNVRATSLLSQAGQIFQVEDAMSDVVYVSKARIERKQGPTRIAYLPGEPQPVIFSVHGAIAEHYRMDPAKLTESHSSTIDYVIAATAG